jgi:capsular polysaccharide biosynthesis protein
VLCAAIIGGACALWITHYTITPLYQATIKLYANNSTQESSVMSSSDVAASKSLVDTYIMIIRSDTVLDEVIALTKCGYSAGRLNSSLSASAMNSTEVFSVTVTDPDPIMAAAIANAIAEVAPGHLEKIVDRSSVKVVDNAKVPRAPSSPDYQKNTMLGLLAGACLAIVIIVLMTLFDVHIYSETDLRNISDLPILGFISDFEDAAKSGYSSYYTAGGAKDKGSGEK